MRVKYFKIKPTRVESTINKATRHLIIDKTNLCASAYITLTWIIKKKQTNMINIITINT